MIRVHRLGVVTGSRIEARCLGNEPTLLIACSGADVGCAQTATARLIDQGVEGLISFGLAGALDPALCPGDLMLPETVLTLAQRCSPPLPAPVSASWRDDLHRRLAAAALRPIGGALAGSNELIRSPQRKAQLHRSTGALAVDMESHVVAALAGAAGLPWLVLRGIADPADLALPDFIARALAPDGRVRPAVIARGLIREPHALPALLKLRANSRTALRSLTRAAGCLVA